MSYKHLSLEEKRYIELEDKKGTSQSKIAKTKTSTGLKVVSNILNKSFETGKWN